jgi:hypothetical protein
VKIYKDGSKSLGIWKDGKLFQGQVWDKEGNVLETYEKGVKVDKEESEPVQPVEEKKP